MESRSVLLTTLTILSSVHSWELEILGHYSDGLYLEHDFPHPLKPSSSRHTREVGKPRRHHVNDGLVPFKYCCGGENNTVHTSEKENMEVMKQCVQKLVGEDEWSDYGNPTKDPFTCENMKKGKNGLNCFMDCMARGNGLLGEDGREDVEKWEDMATRDLAFPWLKDLVSKALQECIANKDYSWLENGDSLECSPRAMNVNHCVWRQVIMICPEEHFVKTPYCEKSKKAFEENVG